MSDRISIAAVGDISLGRHVQVTLSKNRAGYLFDRVQPVLGGHDIVFGNLESPISSMHVPEGSTALIANPSSLDELRAAGFNAVSIANNHITDFGLPVVQETIHELEKRGIGYAGAGLSQSDASRPLRNVAGKRAALLAYYGIGGGAGDGRGPNRGDTSTILRDIRNACREADLVLVSIHWGRATGLPMRHQVEFAHRMVDQGAQVILGSGPHVLQPVELYHGGVIAYSLGNFVFDHRDWQESMVLHVTFANGQVESAHITPVCLAPDHRPEPVDPDTNRVMYDTIQSLLVQRLDKYESDARLVPHLRGSDLTPLGVLRKLVLKNQRAYPLSFYLGGLWELIKQRWFVKS